MLNGAAAGLSEANIGAADIVQRRTIVVLGMEVVDDLRATGTGANERIHRFILIEEHVDVAGHLVGIVATDDTLTGGRVVSFADA